MAKIANVRDAVTALAKETPSEVLHLITSWHERSISHLASVRAKKNDQIAKLTREVEQITKKMRDLREESYLASSALKQQEQEDNQS